MQIVGVVVASVVGFAVAAVGSANAVVAFAVVKVVAVQVAGSRNAAVAVGSVNVEVVG